MPKEILLYGSFFSFTAADFIEQIEEARDEDITLRIDSDGGDPQSAFGMVAKFQEHEGSKLIKVDGRAQSTAAFFLAYANNSEALDVSEFLLHRAAFPSFIEDSPTLFTDARQQRLAKINKDLRKALEAKIDIEAFEKITKVTLNDLFSMEGRVEVVLNAKEAKKIGLINKIVPITPKIKAEIETHAFEANQSLIAAQSMKETKSNNNEMDITKFKNEYPAIYALVLQAGVEQGMAQAADNTQAWITFLDIDPKAVKAGLESGKPPTTKDFAEFTLKGISGKTLEVLESDAPDETNTSTPKEKEEAITAKEKEMKDFEAEVNAGLDIKVNQ